MDQKCIGVDIGGTSVKLGLFQGDGTLLRKWEIPTRKENGGAYILEDIAASIRRQLSEEGLALSDLEGAGMGLPGPVLPDGHIEFCVNLGWKAGNPQETLSGLLDGLPVKSGNDANVAALGEMWQGGAKGYEDVVLVTLGTGVGGGVIVHGRILSGSTGSAGEIGHVHVEDEEETPCNCGNRGCLEQYVSATGVVRLANRKLAAGDRPSVLRNRPISAKAVWDAVKMGDPLAMEVAEDFGWYLGKALAAVAGVVNPEIFVIGGGVSKAGNVLIDYIQKNYQKYAFSGCRGALFTLARLGNDAGIYGSAKMVLD